MKDNIPERFVQQVDNHIVGNLLDIKDFPLILSIFGDPGVGKTYQLRAILEERGFNVHSINAADLESENAGEPTKRLRNEYVLASAEITGGKGAAIVIDDIDTTLGEWERNTGTVNHQDLLAFIMHIADSPTKIEGVGDGLNRVPIFFTGNYFDRLYQPIKRSGRMNVFLYSPTADEKRAILCSIFGDKYSEEIQSFIERKPNEPISYFSAIKANVETEIFAQQAKKLDFGKLVSDEKYRSLSKSLLYQSLDEIEWPKYFV